MRTLHDMFARRNELAFLIEHGQPYLINEYNIVQQELLEEGRRWIMEYEEATMRSTTYKVTK
jgi:hypothetical protein